MDAIRGSAIVGILVLHATAHFSLQIYPQGSGWLAVLDRAALRGVASVFAGKAYALFAMMFGLSFVLIMDSARRRAAGFGGRFVWRLAILAVFGIGTGLIYSGSVLHILALFGLTLLFFQRMESRTLACISLLLLAQLPSVWQIWASLDPAFVQAPSRSAILYGGLMPVYAQEDLVTVMRANFASGLAANGWFHYENGRHFQILGLYLWGLLLGRSRVFDNQAATISLARRAVLAGAIASVLIGVTQWWIRRILPDGPTLRIGIDLLVSYSGVAKMLLWAGVFIWTFYQTPLGRWLRLLAPTGRMSLTCYVVQSIVGVFLFYGFGAGLYRTLGAFHSLCLGAFLAIVQGVLAWWWLQHFRYGPLEWLWRCLTYLDFGTPLRHRGPLAAEAQR